MSRPETSGCVYATAGNIIISAITTVHNRDEKYNTKTQIYTRTIIYGYRGTCLIRRVAPGGGWQREKLSLCGACDEGPARRQPQPTRPSLFGQSYYTDHGYLQVIHTPRRTKKKKKKKKSLSEYIIVVVRSSSSSSRTGSRATQPRGRVAFQ